MAPGSRLRSVVAGLWHVSRRIGGTLGTATKWLMFNPTLVGLFLLAGIISAAGGPVSPLSTVTRFALLATVAGTFVLLFATGVAHRFADRLLAGEHPRLLRAAGPVSGRMPALVGMSVAYFVISAVAYVFLIVPGVYVSTRLSLAYPACIVDGEGVLGSLRTSWRVAHGQLWTILGITVVAMLVAVALSVAIVIYLGFGPAILAGDEWGLLVLTAVTLVVRSIFGPLVQLAYAQVYIENRAR